MLQVQTAQKNVNFVFIVVLLFSLGLRLFFLFFTGGYTSPYITSDSILYHNYVIDILNGNTRLLYTGAQLEGGISVRLPSFLYFEYLIVGYFLTGDLMGSKIILSALSILPLYFTYLFLKKINPNKPAANLLVVFLYSINFNNLLFNISNWNSNFIGILIPIMVYYLYLWIIEKKENALIKLSFLHCVLAQFHILAYFLLPFYPLYILLYKHYPNLKTLSYALLPWLIFVFAFITIDAHYDFRETIKLYHFVKTNNPQSNSFISFLVYGIFYMTSSPIAFFYYKNFFTESYLINLFPNNTASLLHVPLWVLLSYFLSILIFIATPLFILSRLYLLIKKRELVNLLKHPLFPFALWILIPIVIYFISKRPYNPRYAQLFLPFNFIFIYLLLFHSFKQKILSRTLGYAYIILHCLLYIPFFSFLNNLTSNYPYFITSDKNLSALKKMINQPNSEQKAYFTFEPKYISNPSTLSHLNFNTLNDFFIPTQTKSEKNPLFYIILDSHSDFFKENSSLLFDGQKITSTKNLYLYKMSNSLLDKYPAYRDLEKKIDEERFNEKLKQTL